MNTKRTVRILGLVLVVVLAGCAGGPGGDAGAADGTTGEASDGSDGASTDWCPRGQTSRFANPETGEQVSMEIQGVVERDGRQVCRAVWETNQGEVRRIEMLFTEDGSYRKMISYDEDDDVVNEVEMTGPAGDGSADGASSSAEWCSEASSMSFVNPETGEHVSMQVEGIVEHDGRQVCRAVWETNQGDVRKVEMLFTEDRSYQVMITYDEDGEVVDEVVMSGGSSDG